jgi:ABC-type transport system substrate-binding protein
MIMVMLAFGACGGQDQGGDTSTPSNKDDAASKDADENGRYDKVVAALPADPGDLMPWNAFANQKKPIYQMIYDTLFDFIDGQYVPCIAKEYSETSDLSWDVELFDYVKDWEGNPITADDIVNCYNRYVDSGYAMKFDVFKNIEKVDDYTVRFNWNKPVDTVAALDHIWCDVQLYADEAWGEDGSTFATTPVASGQYKLENYTGGSKIILMANDDYWQTDESLIDSMRARNVDTVEYDVVTEASQNVVGLQTGVLDISLQGPNESISEFENSDGFMTQSFMTNDCFYLVCNQSEDNVCSDLNLRQAIYYAIDGDALAMAVAGTVACTGFAGSASDDFVEAWADEKTYFNTVDMDMAKDYLSKSKYNGEELVLMGQNTEAGKTIMTLVQSQLDQIGIKVKINAVEEAQAMANTSDPTSYDLTVGRCGGGFVIDAMNRTINRGEYDGNFCMGFRNDDTLQELFDVAHNQETWNDESMTAVFDYVVANAVNYTMITNDFNVVCTSDFRDIYKWDMFVIPSACTFNM